MEQKTKAMQRRERERKRELNEYQGMKQPLMWKLERRRVRFEVREQEGLLLRQESKWVCGE